MLQVGDTIPDFTLMSDTAGEVKASELRNKRFVLYFYPRDDTPGCTTEACSFRDNLPHFRNLDVPVFGISPDDVTAHARFTAKFDLNFPLLADPEHTMAEAFGTWVEKSNYGRVYMGVQRSTFVVGPDGRIEQVWPKVTPATHVEEVLAYFRSLSEAGAGAPPAASDAQPVVAPPAATRRSSAKKASARPASARKTRTTKKTATGVKARKSAVRKSERR